MHTFSVRSVAAAAAAAPLLPFLLPVAGALFVMPVAGAPAAVVVCSKGRPAMCTLKSSS